MFKYQKMNQKRYTNDELALSRVEKKQKKHPVVLEDSGVEEKQLITVSY